MEWSFSFGSYADPVLLLHGKDRNADRRDAVRPPRWQAPTIPSLIWSVSATWDTSFPGRLHDLFTVFNLVPYMAILSVRLEIGQISFPGQVWGPLALPG